MRGLVNRGTNCSLNSVVQCLYGTRELRGLIREVRERDYGPATTPAVAPTLKRLVYELADAKEGPCDPGFLLGSMGRYGSFHVQRDAESVFGAILVALTDGVGPAKQIAGLWDITTEKRVRCIRCNAFQSTLETSNTIPVFVGGNHPEELQEYMKCYSDNMLAICDYRCGHCHERAQCEITSGVISLPPVVCIKIARVQRVCGDTVKTGKRLAFPETLDLKCITKGPGVNAEDPYELYAVVAHRGTHRSGHYTAYVRGCDSWYLADDTRVTLCSWRDVKRTYEAGSIMCDGVAYMLMYQRKHSR
ncbi:hypothetical protein KUCAC02_025101 [Chaenocephalus aceratus]|nr:hypothetical protein KUCAC02_025101 [Chaenocephalus aceratus]